MFDNIIITYDKRIADEFAKHTWKVKHTEENRIEEEELKKVTKVPLSPSPSLCFYFTRSLPHIHSHYLI
jgi:hypothetical protein